jgi:hypothetical protein
VDLPVESSIFDNLVVRTSQLILSRSLFEALILKMASCHLTKWHKQVEPEVGSSQTGRSAAVQTVVGWAAKNTSIEGFDPGSE